jgi:hypothetical protein
MNVRQRILYPLIHLDIRRASASVASSSGNKRKRLTVDTLPCAPAPACLRRGPRITIQLQPICDLHLMHALARDAPKHSTGTLGPDGLELSGTLNE